MSKAVFEVGVDEALKTLKVNQKTGLTDDEAKDRLAKYGPNELPAEERTPFWKLVLEQFDDQLVKILLAAAVTSFVLALFESEEDRIQAFTEPAVILTILILNAIVGVVQESNAEAAIEALKEYESEVATVIREGRTRQIPARELVPGDIIICDVGTKVPADARVVNILSSTVNLDQSALTGESVAVSKLTDAIPSAHVNQDKKNLLFSGTNVTRGKVVGAVFATGSQTEIGKINQSLSEAEKTKTPLQLKLDEFGEQLSKIIMVICIVVWLINIGHFNDPIHGGSWVKGAIYYFKVAVALAVAAIPEGLPAVVTTCLALGTRKMAQKNAIVRSLPSVETLGCTSVICSDKTGTLTTNKMSVQRVLVQGATKLDELVVSGTDYTPQGDVTQDGKALSGIAPFPAFQMLSKVCAICNESQIVYESGKYDRIGEPTEAALKVLVEKLGHHDGSKASDAVQKCEHCCKKWQSEYERLAILEFTRHRKSMSVLIKEKSSGKNFLFVKGAPESILERSTQILRNDGKTEKLSEQDRESFKKKLVEYGTGELTLRCLAMAYVEDAPALEKLDFADTNNFEKYESNMVFVGVVGMVDPPRPEVREAVAKCHNAGIRVVVITGDNKNTAEAICRRIGVFSEGEDLKGRSFTGQEFDNLSAAQKTEAVKTANLFARTEPIHKKLLVDMLQQQGHVVAMTGDGVNDAPALQKADIGIAMGTGTAVAKGAGDMVLADDNFATIVVAVEEGRAIFNNTKQFIRYLISSNIGEVACIFLTAALGLPEALIPVQLLWVNLVTDGLPATALGFNKPDKDIMALPPRDSKESIVDRWLFFRYMVIGIYVGLGTVGGFIWWYCFYAGGPQISFDALTHWNSCNKNSGFSCSIFSDESHNRASTVSLSILVTIEMFNAANALSENQSLISQPIWTNVWLVLAIALSFTLHFMILYIPAMASIFMVSPLNLDEWKAVVAFSAPILAIDEFLKFVARASGRGSRVHAKKHL
eukprot:c11593_g1_i1.p1 GENE.c11593_g1_i1~~c11593_g1_i1.p1  ORF type:complete len:1015 (+),score=278.67 c11593_g1_i1:75-3047(+)